MTESKPDRPRWRWRKLTSALLLLLLGLAGVAAAKHEKIRRRLEVAMTPVYDESPRASPLAPQFDAKDQKRKQLAIGMEVVASGLEQPTDIQFPPGADGYAVVLSKTGVAHWVRLADGRHDKLFSVDVKTESEEGLLGIAFHPQFAKNGRFFINYVTAVDKRDLSRVAEWQLTRGEDFSRSKAKHVRVLLEVEQPYANHNGGCLQFGPDGYLYIGLGDGGSREDPHGNGQNPSTLLGKMLRIDVDTKSGSKAYGIPRDNPFVDKPGFAPEIFAYGLRNPWRYSFDPKGRLIVADVGQDTWEEVDIVQAGDNLGWAVREAFACFARNKELCERSDLIDPVFSYGRGDGVSVTGGYVYTGSSIPALRGLYVLADFGTGRFLALPLPDDRKQRIDEPIALGTWPVMPTTFGRDPQGELYVGQFRDGELLKIVPAKAAAPAQR